MEYIYHLLHGEIGITFLPPLKDTSPISGVKEQVAKCLRLWSGRKRKTNAASVRMHSYHVVGLVQASKHANMLIVEHLPLNDRVYGQDFLVV